MTIEYCHCGKPVGIEGHMERCPKLRVRIEDGKEVPVQPDPSPDNGAADD